jgi:putative protease
MSSTGQPPELLAPAGSLEAGYAAFQHGADAVYLGLKRFSARADAANFDLGEVAELADYAHTAFTPARRVYVTLNTVLLEHELPAVAELLAQLELAAVDALIVQDLGLCRLAHEHFPALRLHASTQMAIHSAAGAAQLHRLGLRRVVLARELTIAEIAEVAALPDLEVEVFLHGALCYAYSGLCLLSSHLRGVSGNRGCCSYLCRNAFRVDDGQNSMALMSMKDLALADALPGLRQAGVRSLKIEGRKKSPLYVATVTRYYRGLLDGTLTDGERRRLEHDVKTVFSRPWTSFHTKTTRERGVTDPATVGHRGAPVGTVDTVLRGDPEWLVFTVRERTLERFDGLQLDLQEREKPFGFGVEEIRLCPAQGKADGRSVFAAEPGTRVAVPLPPRHPHLPAGIPVYCGSSQAVKRSYRWSIPRPGAYGMHLPVDFCVVRAAAAWTATATARLGAGRGLTVTAELPAATPGEAARDPAAVLEIGRQAFQKLGGTVFACGEVAVSNPDGLFARMSDFNELRRRVVTALDAALAARMCERAQQALILVPNASGSGASPPAPLAWEIAVDRPEFLGALTDVDLQGAEITLFIHRLTDAELDLAVAELASRVGKERLRLALPTVVRPGLAAILQPRIRRLQEAGYQRWEVSNLAGLTYLDGGARLDLAAGWPLYVLNRLAAATLTDLDFSSVTCSPEDGRGNLVSLLGGAGVPARVILYQDTPLAISAVCAFSSARGGCSGNHDTCAASSMRLESKRADRLLAINDHGQTAIVNATPLSWSHHLDELLSMGARRFRAEFVWRPYAPDEVARIWSRVRRGERLEASHEGNWEHGLDRTAGEEDPALTPD